MLFNSHVFLFLFLPLTLIGFMLLRRGGCSTLASLWIIGLSLFFYQSNEAGYPLLLVTSVVANYALSQWLLRNPPLPPGTRHVVFAAGLLFNLGLLGYFKYATFAIGILQQLTDIDWILRTQLLPLGISFFTFTQLMYLVDAHSGLIEKPYRFRSYMQFVVFFPYLIAGPIARHDEIIPQLENPGANLSPEERLAGWSFLALGLFKKVVIADNLARYVNPIFSHAAEGAALNFFAAWGGALAYTLQLYFDFSGYSDMAVGCGRLFGISLPFNFNSPFKAKNVIEFWQRWHMTLTRFLTNYIYNPLVLSISRWRLQHGAAPFTAQRPGVLAFIAVVAIPTLITMLAAGVWHGAGWPFVAFGVLHGVYLVINHAWRAARGKHVATTPELLSYQGMTFLCVAISLVFFRSKDMATAMVLFQGMAGKNGFTGGAAQLGVSAWGILLLLMGVVWGLPNTQQWIKPSRTQALIIGLLAGIAVLCIQSSPEFLYFEF